MKIQKKNNQRWSSKWTIVCKMEKQRGSYKCYIPIWWILIQFWCRFCNSTCSINKITSLNSPTLKGWFQYWASSRYMLNVWHQWRLLIIWYIILLGFWVIVMGILLWYVWVTVSSNRERENDILYMIYYYILSN